MKNPFRPAPDNDDDMRHKTAFADKMIIFFAAVISVIGMVLAVNPPDFSVLDEVEIVPSGQVEPGPSAPKDEVLVPIFTPKKTQ